MGPRYRFPVTPLWRSPSPPSHILLVLARVSSCCLQFLNPFGSRQRFLAAEVAAGQAGLGGAPEAAGNLGGGEQTGVSLLAESLVLLCVLPSLASSLTVGCVGPQGLWLHIPGAHGSSTHPPCCLEPPQLGQKAEVGVSSMFIPPLSRALSPCTERWLRRDVCESRAGAAESAAAPGGPRQRGAQPESALPG